VPVNISPTFGTRLAASALATFGQAAAALAARRNSRRLMRAFPQAEIDERREC
jgi:hypothetical protein